jgi:cation transport regulator ChaC
MSDPTWVFGYGSLIYKVDFPFLARRPACIEGWERRFWQGSHDHRGTPESPGRVVTLVPSPGARCRGVAYLVEPAVFGHLDHREKNGYQRHRLSLFLDGEAEPVAGLIYVAGADNPAFLGPAPLDELAAHIAVANGPSGSNREYLIELARALHELDSHDEHVHALAERVKALSSVPGVSSNRAPGLY